MGDEERETPGATRSQHTVLQGPADSRTIAAALRPGMERSREIEGNAAPACLVITPTVEHALSAADQARTLLDDDALRVVPVSAPTRARRVLAAGPVAVVVGTPLDLLELRRAAALGMESLRAVVVVGLDEQLADGALSALEALLADTPVAATRVATLDMDSPATDAFIDAHLRRARRVSPLVISDASLATVPRYAISGAAGRAELLRAVLDDIDPPSLVIVASSESGELDARRALARLGVTVNGDTVHVTRHALTAHAALVVLWEAPAGTEALTEAVAARPVDAIVFLQPDEVPSYHRLTGGSATPWTPPARKEMMESRTRTLRSAIRSTLVNGGASASELTLLAPLLDMHDPLEIAAAALRLYEGARRDALLLRSKASLAIVPQSPRPGSMTTPRGSLSLVGKSVPAGKQRVFLAVGKRDGARVGDIVGAVANEAGVPGERIGTVELYESHATVELDGADAEQVVARMENTMLRGRKLGARLDERGTSGGAYGASKGRGDRFERAPRSAGGERPARAGVDRAERGAGDHGDRPARPARSGFGADRGERSERPVRSAGDRVVRSGTADRGRDDERSAPRGPARSAGAGTRGNAARSGTAAHGAPAHGDAPRGAGARGAGPRGAAPRGGAGEGRGAPHAAELRRAFNDRPARERAESTGEWAERGDRMKHAKRVPRQAPPANHDEG